MRAGAWISNPTLESGYSTLSAIDGRSGHLTVMSPRIRGICQAGCTLNRERIVQKAEPMISRRDFFGIAPGLISPVWLCAQVQRPVVWVKFSVTVTDSHTRYINGLKPSDFRVFEDGILQKISTFAEGTKPPSLVNADGTTRPVVDDKVTEGGKPGIDLTHEDGDLSDSYIITYYPDPSNHNEGFRKINIEIAPDTAKNYRVRTRPGYRMRAPEVD